MYSKNSCCEGNLLHLLYPTLYHSLLLKTSPPRCLNQCKGMFENYTRIAVDFKKCHGPKYSFHPPYSSCEESDMIRSYFQQKNEQKKTDAIKSRWWFHPYFGIFTPEIGEMIQFDLRIFLRWVGSTTNQNFTPSSR